MLFTFVILGTLTGYTPGNSLPGFVGGLNGNLPGPNGNLAGINANSPGTKASLPGLNVGIPGIGTGGINVGKRQRPQIVIQIPESAQNQKGNYNIMPNTEAPYAPNVPSMPNMPNIPYQYQYQYDNSKAQQYDAFIGAALSPAILPFSYYPMPAPNIDPIPSIPNMMSKPSKKKQSNSFQSSKRPSHGSDKTTVPYISISLAPNPSYRDSGLVPNGKLLKSEYSLNKAPTPDLAAYFNFLNTYNPNEQNHNQPNSNKDNGMSSQIVQPPTQYNFNPYTSPFSSQFNYNGKPHQTSSQMNRPSNVQNSFANPNIESPYSNSHSSFIGNIPVQFYGSSSTTGSNSHPFEYLKESEESGEEVTVVRRPRFQ